MMSRLFAISVLALVGCRDTKGKQPEPSPAPAPIATGDAATANIEAQAPSAADAAKKKDDSKGDQEDSEWTPAEFKKGMSRWKDVGVYVD